MIRMILYLIMFSSITEMQESNSTIKFIVINCQDAFNIDKKLNFLNFIC